MKIMLILFLLTSACAATTFIPKIVPGKYSHEHEEEVVDNWVGKEQADLTLNTDSTFSLDIQFANSCIPGKAAGKWKCIGNTIALHDTSGSYYDLTFHVNNDGSLTGSYGGNEEYIFKVQPQE